MTLAIPNKSLGKYSNFLEEGTKEFLSNDYFNNFYTSVKYTVYTYF